MATSAATSAKCPRAEARGLPTTHQWEPEMRVLRIFLKGLNNNFVELPAGEVSMNQIITVWRMEGVITKDDGQGAAFSVPWDGWSFCAILQIDVPDQKPGSSFDFLKPMKPN
jgi:hypothetical protein